MLDKAVKIEFFDSILSVTYRITTITRGLPLWIWGRNWKEGDNKKRGENSTERTKKELVLFKTESQPLFYWIPGL